MSQLMDSSVDIADAKTKIKEIEESACQIVINEAPKVVPIKKKSYTPRGPTASNRFSLQD